MFTINHQIIILKCACTSRPENVNWGMPRSRYRFRPPDLQSVAYYHVVSRIVDKRKVLDAVEREELIKQMRRYEALGGLRVVTYCIMSNHFHILVEVPPRPQQAGPLFTEEAWLRHIEGSLGKRKADGFRDLFEMYRGNGCAAQIAEVMAAYEKRMFNVSCFMQNVKQTFSTWFNQRSGRQGTLWEETFRSVLVEGAGPSLATMAAYIDLNPVRARLVNDPAEYLWSGYGEATAAGDTTANGGKARAGLAIVGRVLGLDTGPWDEIAARYRNWIYGEGQVIHSGNGTPGRAGFDLAEIERVRAAGGKLSLQQLVHIKVRYFSRAGAFGTAGFIDSVFQSARERFGAKRKTGARKMKGVETGDLRVLRDLSQGLSAPLASDVD
jgi:putative transposase